MSKIQIVGFSVLGYLLSIQQAFAAHCDVGIICGHGFDPAPVPEMNASSAVMAIGLIAGLVALLREKFFRK